MLHRVTGEVVTSMLLSGIVHLVTVYSGIPDCSLMACQRSQPHALAVSTHHFMFQLYAYFKAAAWYWCPSHQH